MYYLKNITAILAFFLIAGSAFGQSSTKANVGPESDNNHFSKAPSGLSDISVREHSEIIYFNVHYKKDEQGSLFLLQRKTEGQDFEVVDNKKGAPVKIEKPILYSLNDSSPICGEKSHYQVVKVNEEGMEILAEYYAVPDKKCNLTVQSKN